MTSTPISPHSSLSHTTIGSEFSELWTALASQYAVERELGRGGMGAVFLARDVRLDRFVAIKVLPPHLAAESELRELFLREARTAGRLSHPNIVAVFRADELAGHPFFAMPFIEGENLAERVSAQGPLPAADAVRFLREVAWALAYAHARGVVHRDVKPENIMIEHGSGRAIVTDFGIARVEFGPTLTQDGLIVGTASYMSPEQIDGESLDGRSDLYALGIVGFLLLSGRLPFAAPSVSAILYAHLNTPAPSLASVAPRVPEPIAAVIDRCLEKNRDARYPTGESLADALEKALRISEPALTRTGEFDARSVSPREAALALERAAAMQSTAARELSERMASTPTVYTVRELEAEATAAGIPVRLVRRALADVKPPQ
ncbi:MAG TPA: serine/threonine-protein kinase [Gemmatimonadaceae bacterium]|jgi:serine/threonine-protein kinase